MLLVVLLTFLLQVHRQWTGSVSVCHFQQPRQLFSAFTGTWTPVNFQRFKHKFCRFSGTSLPSTSSLPRNPLCLQQGSWPPLTLLQTQPWLVSRGTHLCQLWEELPMEPLCNSYALQGTEELLYAMGCIDTSLLRGTDPSSCCIALTRMRNEGQPGSDTVFFCKIDSKDGGWKRDKTNPTESFTNIPTGRKSGRAEGCTLYSLIYRGAYLWYALIWVRGNQLYLAANIWKN